MVEPPISVLVVDDEHLARARLLMLLGAAPDVVVVGQCANGLETLDAITTHRPELVFLDVQMPDLDGLGVLDALGPDQCPALVFVTAYNAYMERAFEVHAVDYLRKPYTDARFAAALGEGRRRVLGRRRERVEVQSLTVAEDRVALRAVLDATRADRRDGSVGVWNRRLKQWAFLAPEVIDVVAADGDRQVAVRARGETFTWNTTLRGAEQQLGPRHLLRVHRSWLVNPASVRQVKAITKGEYTLTLADGTVLDTGRTFRRVVEGLLYGR